MAGWNNATMTDVGAALQAKVNAGLTKLTFTKIKVGSGVSTTNAQALTDVIVSKWETTNFTVKRDGKIVTVDTFITNTGITEAFRMTEIGLFARDPDKGEVLYAYLTDSEPDRMPAEGGSTVVSQELSLGMTFSNSGNVTLTVNMGALVTREQLEQHNSDPNAHGGLMTKVQNEVKVATDALATHNTDNNAHTAKFAKYIEKAKLSITSGEVEDGGTVPIPSGFARNECTVLVSLKSSNVAQGYFDINEKGINTALQTECSYDSSTGTVHVGLWVRGTEHSSLDKNKRFDGNGDTWYKGTATYICIAQKA